MNRSIGVEFWSYETSFSLFFMSRVIWAKLLVSQGYYAVVSVDVGGVTCLDICLFDHHVVGFLRWGLFMVWVTRAKFRHAHGSRWSSKLVVHSWERIIEPVVWWLLSADKKFRLLFELLLMSGRVGRVLHFKIAKVVFSLGKQVFIKIKHFRFFANHRRIISASITRHLKKLIYVWIQSCYSVLALIQTSRSVI